MTSLAHATTNVRPFPRVDDGASEGHTLTYARRLMREAITASPLVKRSNEVLVLSVLSDYMSKTGGDMYPSLDTLADKTRLHRSTVSRILTALCDERGLLESTTPRSGGRQTTRFRFGPALRSCLQGPRNAMATVAEDDGRHRAARRQPSQDATRSEDLIRRSDQKEGIRDASPADGDVDRSPLLAAFGDLWAEKYHLPYRVTVRDREHEAVLAKGPAHSLEKLRTGMRAMLGTTKPGYTAHRHPFWMFVQDIDQHLPAVDTEYELMMRRGRELMAGRFSGSTGATVTTGTLPEDVEQRLTS